MSQTYHGPRPVTQPDMTMAKSHLQDTLKMKKQELAMNNQKIADHQQASAATNIPASKSYNQAHIQGHVKDNKVIKDAITERQNSLKTLSSLKPIGGLAGYLNKKKFGAAGMAKMAVVGKKP